MATANPVCSRPVLIGHRPDVDVYCRCGWALHGLRSRARAKTLHAAHRFPGDPLEPVFSAAHQG